MKDFSISDIPKKLFDDERFTFTDIWVWCFLDYQLNQGKKLVAVSTICRSIPVVFKPSYRKIKRAVKKLQELELLEVSETKTHRLRIISIKPVSKIHPFLTEYEEAAKYLYQALKNFGIQILNHKTLQDSAYKFCKNKSLHAAQKITDPVNYFKMLASIDVQEYNRRKLLPKTDPDFIFIAHPNYLSFTKNVDFFVTLFRDSKQRNDTKLFSMSADEQFKPNQWYDIERKAELLVWLTEYTKKVGWTYELIDSSDQKFVKYIRMH